MIIFTEEFRVFFNDLALKKIADQCLKASLDAFNVNNGNIPKWSVAIEELKTIPKTKIELNEPYISIGQNGNNTKIIETALKRLLPWRKGPFIFDNLKLESEWQGGLKWQRLQNHITPLKNRRVLDVGAGNGYFTLRMAIEGASKALGIEPFLLFNYQYAAIKSLSNSKINAMLLPIRLEEMPKLAIFDSVFSMGVLYHQRDHMQHLSQLMEMMAPDAELILETLVVEGPNGYSLIPEGRYAQMRNVHCLPSIETLKSWLVKANFKNIKVIDINKTTPEEQRKSEWIGDNAASLEDFLDPSDSSLTKEGHPAPTRVIIICQN
ncbi:MAG: tRNA 5-methoxyuridine(34)/uridine 5-oxyacetic acid(34) synthase CmoB [Gammaproteobacteria bacterium]|jgi:tRNA (mo5U34)-methyltransferase|tara:strand:- start:426 stop:1391 length:966 start_codon:yes stop_codon:yes gene_type:complete